MKTSQIVFLGLALFLTVSAVRSYQREGCSCGGLGAGTNPCSCSDFLVRAAKQPKPAHYASPLIINEAAAARAAAMGPAGCDGGSPQARDLEGGLSVQDLLTLGPHARVAPKLSPIGDLCSIASHRSAVLPAYPGKPSCRACQTAARNSEGALEMAESSATANAGAFGVQRSFNGLSSNLNSFDEDDGMSFDEQESIYNGNAVPIAPADAVSLSLAYGLARRVAKIIPEEKLAFGPRTLPADGHIKQTIPDIPEERLFAVDKPIVELRAAPRVYGSGSGPCSALEEDLAEQEALEQQRLELEAEAQAQEQSGAPSFISYSDLGYAPVGPSNNNFVSTQPTSYSGISGVPGFSGDSSAPCGPLGSPLPGYRSGVVISDDDQSNDQNGAYGNGSCGENSQEQDGSYSAEDEDDEEQSGGILARLRSAARKIHHHQHGSSCGCSQ
ncbi:uncharacterized protein LOC107266577 [Cephus cinctus]|uniref:Uncharacterized protein LOC107266577 n=1 Tax=Cephus cinctus TaxID=211228 RepID=A0AAJ7BRT7_CEPCN|nr:uncharacterized protein LOC107266577 [Cephus cinctus]